jgi:hypothetical protein
MTSRNQIALATCVSALCFAIAGASFYLGIVTMTSGQQSPHELNIILEDHVEKGEYHSEAFRLADIGADENKAYITLNLSRRLVIDFILAKADENFATNFLLYASLSINGSAGITLGTDSKPVFSPIQIKNRWQYAYPGNMSLTLPVDPTCNLTLTAYHDAMNPTLNVDILIGYTFFEP